MFSIILRSNMACVRHIAHEGGEGGGYLGFHHFHSVWRPHAKKLIHDMVTMRENMRHRFWKRGLIMYMSNSPFTTLPMRGGGNLGFHHSNSVWWPRAKKLIHDMVRNEGE